MKQDHESTAAAGEPMRGACFCGAVQVVFARRPRSVVNCHCGQCRRLSGAAFTTWASFAQAAMHVEGGEHLTAFAATHHVERHFCSRCGSHVYTRDKRMPKVVGVPAGVLPNLPELAPSAHYFASDKAAWHVIGDSRPSFGGESGMDPIPSSQEHS